MPGGESTAVLYDQIFLRGGPATALTACVPLGNCAINGGGLLYLKDSSKLGEELENEFSEAAKDLTEEERQPAYNQSMLKTGFGAFLEQNPWRFSKKWGNKWLATDREAGDVVLHDAYNIHARALDETNVIRLATGLRFIQKGKPFDERWMTIWHVSCCIWSNTRLKYDFWCSPMMDCEDLGVWRKAVR